MKYIKGLDGIRCIAIMLVILYHFGVLSFGWIGVQIFFVLSGYLITGILLHDKRMPAGPFFKRFYWRRMLRIFPLHYGYLALLAMGFFLIPGFWRLMPAFPADAPYLFSYTINFARLFSDTMPGVYVHLWSLAVEEQFYLLWPALVFFTSRRAFGWIALALLALSPLFRWLTPVLLQDGSLTDMQLGKAVYVLTTSHLDAFAIGAVVSLADVGKFKHAERWLCASLAAFLGLGLLHWTTMADTGSLLSFFKSLGYWPHLILNAQHIWGYSLLALISAMAVMCVLQGKRITRWLENPVLVFIGKISYGMYVFHLLVQNLYFEYLPKVWVEEHRFLLFCLYLGTVVLVSWLSYTFFEKKFLALKDRYFTRPREEPVMRVP